MKRVKQLLHTVGIAAQKPPGLDLSTEVEAMPCDGPVLSDSNAMNASLQSGRRATTTCFAGRRRWLEDWRCHTTAQDLVGRLPSSLVARRGRLR
jgi:hypothetical protein